MHHVVCRALRVEHSQERFLREYVRVELRRGISRIVPAEKKQRVRLRQTLQGLKIWNALRVLGNDVTEAELSSRGNDSLNCRSRRCVVRPHEMNSERVVLDYPCLQCTL